MTEDQESCQLMQRLRQTRFAAVLQHCGGDDSPGKLDKPEWQVWIGRETTLDQKRIESHLENLVGPTSSILHVGVGNSKLAQKFAQRVHHILGITIEEKEKIYAESLQIPNYTCSILNKYRNDLKCNGTKFDVIIENSPGCFACCLFHFCRAMINYAALLSDGGMLLSAEPGLSWSADGDTGWWLSWDDWVSIANAVGLQPRRLDEFVYCMQRPHAAETRVKIMVPILMYHSISVNGPANLARYRVSPAAFGQQLEYLRSHGYQPLSLREWAACITRGEAPLGRPVIITFDDGYKDFLIHALPILSSHKFTATIFVVTTKVGGTADWDGDADEALSLMDWRDLREVIAHGMSIESHCATHTSLLAMTDDQIAHDAGQARMRLHQELGVEATMVAFPWGLSDARTRNALAANGYMIGLAASGGKSGLLDDVMDLPRVEIFGDDDVQAFARKIAIEEAIAVSLPIGEPVREKCPAVRLQVSTAVGFANRTQALIEEFVALRSELATALVAPESVEGRFASLFTMPAADAGVMSVEPHRPLSPGVCLGFQKTAEVSVTANQQAGSKGRQRNGITIAFTGQSTFLTIEAKAAWAEIDGCSRFYLSAVVEPGRLVTCHAALRLPVANGASRDHALVRFDLLPGKRLFEREGELALGDYTDVDRTRTPCILVFFDSSTPLVLHLDDLFFQFLR